MSRHIKTTRTIQSCGFFVARKYKEIQVFGLSCLMRYRCMGMDFGGILAFWDS